MSNLVARPRKVLSFGGGVQTLTLSRLILAGEFERPDLVVFADTGREPAAVYEAVWREFDRLYQAGIEAVQVSRGDLGDWQRNGSIHVPLYTVNIETGEKGMLFRTCTNRFKMEAVQSELRFRGWKESRIELWLGMTIDEIERVKPSRIGWIDHRHPLVEMDRTRAWCEDYLRKIGVQPTKSACYFCPYRSWESWEVMDRADLAKAIEYDESIRHARGGHLSYVHRSFKPLREAVGAEKPLSLLDNLGSPMDECEGACEIYG